jgi:macrolide-specific efflux system membrane fusion protein
VKGSENLHKYRWPIAVAAILAILAGGAAFWSWRANLGEAPAYREASVTRGDIQLTILSTGIVQPKNRLEIKAPIPGRAEQVLVDQGDRVHKGQVLAWMSSTERAALMDAARAKGPEELKRWEELYRPTPILAPLDGTLITRNLEPGQTFTSADAVFVMSDYLIVNAQVDETDLAQIRLRQSASIVLDAYPDQPFTGKVDQIAYDAKTVNNVTTYDVEVLPTRTPAFMRSGMTANVSFVLASHHDVLLVPADAVKVHEGRSTVLLVPAQKNGKPVEQEIKTGLSDGKHIEVLDGLTEGQKLLVMRIRTGGTGAANPFSPFGRRH